MQHADLRPNPEAALATAERNAALNAALAELPPLLQKVVELRFGLEGTALGYPEVCARLGTTEEELAALERDAAAKVRTALLAGDDFADLEDAYGNLTGQLDSKTAAYVDREARAAYFTEASQRRVPEPDRAVWELHAAGKSVREIAQRVGRSKSSVDRTIARVRKQVAA